MVLLAKSTTLHELDRVLGIPRNGWFEGRAREDGRPGKFPFLYMYYNISDLHVIYSFTHDFI